MESTTRRWGYGLARLRQFPLTTMLGLLTVLLVVPAELTAPASAHQLDPDDKLTLHQQEALGLTAAEVLEQGIASNEPDGCGNIDLEAGEVGWAFLTPGNHRTNYFTHFIAGFSSGDQEWAVDDPGEATRVRVQGGNTTLVAFKSGFNDTLESAEAWGLQNDDRFNLTHVCVGEEPEEGSVLIEKTYTPVDPEDLSEFTLYKADDEGAAVDGTGVVMDLTVVENGDDRYLYCTDELLFGDYVVSETVTPAGFAEADDVQVTVDEESTCAERLAADDTPDAVIENVAENPDLEVTKLKLNLDGPTNVGLAGFEFTLYEGDEADDEKIVSSSTTGADGTTDFDNAILEVGVEYTVCETGVPEDQENHWTAADCQTFTAELDEDVFLEFFNAPRADVRWRFDDVTGFTSALLTCESRAVDEHGVALRAFSRTIEPGEGGGSLDLVQLDLGEYVCTIMIRNGG